MYCDFYSISDRENVIPRFVNALVDEINQCDIPKKAWIPDTIFIGGGTPSLLEPKHFERILDTLDKKYDLSSLTESTIEINPGEAPLEKLKSFHELGMNRLSMGVQSLDPFLLKFLTRIHGTDEVFTTFKQARKAGFENINCDMIFNVPKQSPEIWKRDLQQIMDLNPEHISAYSLTVEKGTRLFQYVNNGTVSMPGENKSAEFYSITQKMLWDSGFDQYEISNWSKPRLACRHNLHYWRIHPYLSFGPSAHGFDGIHRYSNPKNLDTYLNSIESGQLPRKFIPNYTRKNKVNELIGFGLRISEGVNLYRIPKEFQTIFTDRINQARIKWDSFLIEEKNRLRLTPKGFLFADAIAVDLMI